MALNLKKLEQKIDEALRSETKKSLSEWLKQKRTKQRQDGN